MTGKISLTHSEALTIHTFTAPEVGWQVNSHIVEFPCQLLVVDAQYLLPYAREVVDYAARLKKPIARLFITHYHPDHLLGSAAFSAPLYALNEVSAKIAAVGDRVAGEEHEKFGDDVPTRAERPSNIVKVGIEVIESVPVDFIHLENAETHDALMIGLPQQRILITQDLVYNRVHAMVGEKAFDTWNQALESNKMLNYDKILPGHGTPGGKELFGQMQQYIATARDVFAEASGSEDMKEKMIRAFPDYGGVGMLDQQKRFLFPDTSHNAAAPSRTARGETR
jgi:glyoxylase-like metal-dependent hydrolase (beta-lactamase superfamily II)